MPIINAIELEAPATFVILDKDEKEIHHTYCFDDAILICSENKNYTYKHHKLEYGRPCVSWSITEKEENDGKICCDIL